jgi:hypothetical protein
MKKIIGKDRKGQFLRIGDNVIMPDPRPSDDAWKHGNFTGRIGSDKVIGHKILVIDQEDNAWNVEPDRVERDGAPEYPLYGTDEEKMPNGLYLGLFHGYESEEERAENDGWGENGALIGPLVYVQTTYAYHVKLRFTNEADSKKYGLPSEVCTELPLVEDCLFHDGKYYGDWTVFCITNGKVAE